MNAQIFDCMKWSGTGCQLLRPRKGLLGRQFNYPAESEIIKSIIFLSYANQFVVWYLHYDMVKNRREASGSLQKVVDAALQSPVTGISPSASIILQGLTK